MPALLDGGSPGHFEAVSAGVAAALDERDRQAAPVQVGVNSAGLPDPAFGNQLADAIGPRNTERLDYVRVDAFPDMFRPIAHENLPAAVTFLLRRFRAVTAEAGVSWPCPSRNRWSTRAREKVMSTGSPGSAVITAAGLDRPQGYWCYGAGWWPGSVMLADAGMVWMGGGRRVCGGAGGW